MVAHYNITLSGQDMSGQNFHLMPGTRRIEVPRIPGLSYKGRLSAVSICGNESDPVAFEGEKMMQEINHTMTACYAL